MQQQQILATIAMDVTLTTSPHAQQTMPNPRGLEEKKERERAQFTPKCEVSVQQSIETPHSLIYLITLCLPSAIVLSFQQATKRANDNQP